MQFARPGTSSLIATQTLHIPSVAVEFHEAVDKISAYIDLHCAVHLRQLILVLFYNYDLCVTANVYCNAVACLVFLNAVQVPLTMFLCTVFNTTLELFSIMSAIMK